jgi:hypothetical protein
VLAQSLREIHHKNASALSFEALYRNAYKLVLKKYGDRLYNQVGQLVTEHLQYVAVRDVKPLVPSAVVTGTVGSAIEKRNGGSKFLEQLKAVWEDHQLCMSMITDVLMYMVSYTTKPLCPLLIATPEPRILYRSQATYNICDWNGPIQRAYFTKLAIQNWHRTQQSHSRSDTNGTRRRHYQPWANQVMCTHVGKSIRDRRRK